jgi:beta-glucanase (GH16 family)
LIIDENFDSKELNREIWDTKYTWGRTISSNHELEYYTDRGNITVDSGILYLIAKRESITAKIDSALADTFAFPNRQNLSSYNYTSGMLCSKQEFKYGKFEIHCRMPEGAGMWPAFWLYGGWPADEIDIMEYRGEWQKRASCGVHSYDSTKYRRSGKWTKFASKNFSRQFHTFTCYWYPDVIIFEVDG